MVPACASDQWAAILGEASRDARRNVASSSDLFSVILGRMAIVQLLLAHF